MRFREWLIKQELLLKEDYKTAAQKFERENPQTPPEAIKKYLSDFKKIATKKFKQLFDPIEGVSVPKEKRHDIDSYKTFKELEAVVDHVRGQTPVSGHFGEDMDVDAKPIFENEDLVIYYADSPRACIKYKGNVPYSWCVARKDAGNLFNAYRFKENEPSFYFVKNKKRTKEELGLWNLVKTAFSGEFKDPWHFFVLQVSKNAKTDDKKTQQYIVTSANNDGDKLANWEEILKHEPLLDGLQDIFKPVPLSKEEREDYDRFSKKISDEEFSKLSYEKKNRYIDVHINLERYLTDDQFKSLPEDLKNKYVGLGVGLSDAQYEMIKGSKLEKRYLDVTLEKSKRILQGEFEELADDGYPYGLKNSELDIIKNHLDYNTMTLEDIGKLAGIFTEPKEKEDDGEIHETGGWKLRTKAPEEISHLLDRYIDTKGKIPRSEISIIQNIHSSQAKVIELLGDKIDIAFFQELLKKNFVKGKGFKEEKVKEAFEKRRTEILEKDEIEQEEMKTILTYSEDVSQTINEIKDTALKHFFSDSSSIEWALSLLEPEAARTLAEKLLQSLDELPNHPILLAYAPDVKKALEKMKEFPNMGWHEIVNTFIYDTNRTNKRKIVEINPQKMQEIVEAIFKTNKTPMYWALLHLAQKCSDPQKALSVAAENPVLFKNIGLDNAKDLFNFLTIQAVDRQGNPIGKPKDRNLQQKIAEIVAETSEIHFLDKELLEILVRHSTNKRKILKIVPEKVVKKWAESKGVDHVTSILSKEDLLTTKDLFSKISPHFGMKIGLAIVNLKEYVKSLKLEELDVYWEMIVRKALQDTNMTQQDRSEIIDDILNKKQKFNNHNDERYFVDLINNSSDKFWALKTILSKTYWTYDLFDLLQKGPNAPFQANEIQTVIEIVLSIKKDLSEAQIEHLLQNSPNKDRTAQIIGIDRLKKVAAEPSSYFHAAKDWLKQKGL